MLLNKKGACFIDMRLCLEPERFSQETCDCTFGVEQSKLSGFPEGDENRVLLPESFTWPTHFARFAPSVTGYPILFPAFVRLCLPF
jgi:hypothetical protein